MKLLRLDCRAHKRLVVVHKELITSGHSRLAKTVDIACNAVKHPVSFNNKGRFSLFEKKLYRIKFDYHATFTSRSF